MLDKYQVVTVLPLIVDIVLPPLLIGLVVALARVTARRTIIALAVAAIALVFISIALLDAVTGLHGPLMSSAGDPYSRQRLAVLLSGLLVSAGVSLSFAAVILGLRGTVNMSRWGWFIALLLTQIAATIGMMLFQYPYVSALFNQALYDQLYRGDPAISVPFYLLTILLLIAVPLATLLFAILGVPRTEPRVPVGPAQPAPMSPGAPN